MRKLTKKMLAILFAGLLCVSIGVAAAVLIAGRDIPPPDTSDLTLERPWMPEEENAFFTFKKAASQYYCAYEHHNEFISDYLTGEYSFDEAFVRRTLERNAETFHHLHEGVEREKYIAPERKNPMTPEPYMAEWRALGRLLAVKVRFNRKEGHYEKATETCVLLLRFGNIIKENSDTLIDYLVGFSLHAISLNETRELVRKADITEYQIKRLSWALDSMSPPDASFERVMRGEYYSLSRLLGILKNDSDKLLKLTPDYVPERLRWVLKTSWLYDYFLQPNRTKKDFADVFRNLIENSSRSYAELDLIIAEKQDVQESTDFITLIRRPNAIGKYFVSSFIPALSQTIQRKLQAECEINATRLIVALHAFYKAETRLPKTLDALVPEFLDQVPGDPYDGAPFRYDKSLDVVYSVGKNLEDHGGRDAVQALGKEHWNWRFHGEDYAFPIGIQNAQLRRKR